GPAESARASLVLGVVAGLIGEHVGNLVHSVLDRALRLVDAPLVLQAPVSAERADGFLDATHHRVEVLVGHEPSCCKLTSAQTGVNGGSGPLAARSVRPRTARGPH